MEEEKKKSGSWLLWVVLGVFLLSVAAAGITLVYMVKQYRANPPSTEVMLTLEEKRKKEVLDYLAERYGEEFEIDSYRGRSYAYDYVQMYAHPKGYSDEAHRFQIQGRVNEEGKMEYVDGYVMVRLTDEYASCVDEIIDEYFDDYKFYLEFYSEWMTNQLPADTRVEDLLKLRANVDYPLPRLDILMKSSQKENFTEEHIREMGSRLAEWGYRGPIYVSCYDDAGYYEKKNSENHLKNLEGELKHYECHWMFIENEETIQYD